MPAGVRIGPAAALFAPAARGFRGQQTDLLRLPRPVSPFRGPR